VNLPKDAVFNEDIKIVSNLSYFRPDDRHDGRLKKKGENKNKKKKTYEFILVVLSLITN
jgi:hypothetical protein